MVGTEAREKNLVLETKRWGTLEINKNDILHFERGIPGFEGMMRFAIFESEEIQPFKWLINTENPDLGFVIVPPHVFYPNYNPKLYESDLEELRVAQNNNLALFVIVTLTPNPLKSTANLQGPLLINLTKRLGKQIIIVEEEYSVKHPILAASKIKEKKIEPVVVDY